MLITSIDNKKIKEIKKLQIKKYRDNSNLFLVEGLHLIKEAYKAGLLDEIILKENIEIDIDVKKTYVKDNVMKSISELETSTGIIGICKKKSSDFIKGNILMLDNIQDPGNLGTIIRSAVAFNIDTIILSNNTVDLYNSKTIRASQGMLFHINILIKDLISEIQILKNDNYNIIGTSVTNGTDVKMLEKNNKACIIVGNEGNGISNDIINLCDKFIYINMNNSCESLNVGVAASIILYELDK